MRLSDTLYRQERFLLASASLATVLPLLAAATASAQPSQGAAITQPEQIDRAVASFTGAAIGEVGGARVPADRRLRLAACPLPLDVEWHGRGRSTVKVSCTGPESWNIFVSTRPAPQQADTAPVVNRGDPITVVVRGRGFSVQQSGEAMDNGSAGDWIAVRTSRDATPIRARIERPGLAVIPAG